MRTSDMLVKGVAVVIAMGDSYCGTTGTKRHADFSKKTPGDRDKRASTRTFLLYLDDCGAGGETVRMTPI